MTEALRQKQIREYLDEDLRANREVLRREFSQASAYNDEYSEPSKLEELVSWNIDKQISVLQDAIQNVIDGAIDNQNMGITNQDISKIASAYNLLVSYINTYAKSHALTQRDKAILDTKFKEVEPLLNQVKQILEHPNAYNVEVSAQNLHIIQHIDQQMHDSNIKGLNVVDYRRIPPSRRQPQRALNYRGWAPQQRQPPPHPDVGDDDDDDDGDDGSIIPALRSRNQSTLQTSDLISGLSSRQGSTHIASSSSSTPSRAGAPATLSSSMLSSLASPAGTALRPLSIPSTDESIARVSTLSQADSRPFFSSSKVSPAAKWQQAAAAATAPLHAIAKPPALPKVLFNGKPRGYAMVNGKTILADDGNMIDQNTWLHYTQPEKQEALIKKALMGKGKRGKKSYEPTQRPTLLYNPDGNNMWANY